MTDAAESQHTVAVRKLQALTVRRICERNTISLALLSFTSAEAQHEFAESTQLSHYIFYTFYNVGKWLKRCCVSALHAASAV